MTDAVVRPRSGAADCDVAIHVTLLEQFGVTVDGVQMRVTHAAQRLVALLALNGAPMSRTRVAGTLWPDSTEEHATSCLRSLLWRLRRPRENLLLVDGNALDIGPGVTIDYRTASGRARAYLAGGSTPLEGHASFREELLPGWNDDWVVIERERYRELRLRALEALCRRLTAVGRYGAAVEAGLMAVQIEPLRDTAHHLLIAAHLAEGNRAAALRQYDGYRVLLRRELGLGPAPAVERLVVSLLRVR